VRAWLRWRLVGALYLEGELARAGFKQHTAIIDPAPPGGGQPGDPVTIPAGWRRRLIPSVTLGWDDRDRPHYPSRGGFHRLQARRVASRDFASYHQLTADLRQFLPTPWQHILALHAFGRRVSRSTPLEDRLFWGGEETIRGYGFASLEGEEGYLLSIEYRWPLFLVPLSVEGQILGVGLHLFADAGDTWYHGDDPGRLRSSWGGGVHLNLLSSQFRFEYARTADGIEAFQFGDTFNF